MQKLNFLAGEWSGEAYIFRDAGAPVELLQTERAEYKLDGLLLLIEGVGRSKANGRVALQALGIVSYDDEGGTYHMRAYNDGRYLETQVELGYDGKELRWGFALGEIRTSSVLRLSEHGQWTELHEITVGAQPSRKFMEVRVSPQR
jgi:hypothetical protein